MELSNVAALRAAFHRCETEQSSLTADQARLETLTSEVAALTSEVQALAELESKAAAKRFLDGEDPAPPRPSRVRKLADLRGEVAIKRDAIPLLKERIKEKAAAYQSARADFHMLVIEQTHALRTASVVGIQERLPEIRPHLVLLEAADLLQDGLVGRSFVLRKALPVFSGTQVARSFINGIKDRLRPGSMNTKLVTLDAERIASGFIASIKGS